MNSIKVQEQQLLTVKANHGDEIRRFSIPSDTSWKSLVEKLSSIFTLEKDSFVIKYLDDEKDQVTIDSDSELQEAIRVFTLNSSENGLCLRFMVIVSPQKISTQLRAPESVIDNNNNNNNNNNNSLGGGWRQRRWEGRGRMTWEELKPQLLELEEKGYKCKRRNIRLLSQQGGSVEKVVEILEQNQEKCNKFREAEKQLEEKGFERKGLNFRLLKRFDGDTEKVINLLNKSKQLEEMGFTRTALNIRLLIKFDGDVNRVAEVWAKKQDKMMKKLDKKLKKEEWKRNKKSGMRGSGRRHHDKDWKRGNWKRNEWNEHRGFCKDRKKWDKKDGNEF